MPGLGSIELVEATLMTEPRPRASMARPSARHVFHGPPRLTASMRVQSPSAMSTAGRLRDEMPAAVDEHVDRPRGLGRRSGRRHRARVAHVEAARDEAPGEAPGRDPRSLSAS